MKRKLRGHTREAYLVCAPTDGEKRCVWLEITNVHGEVSSIEMEADEAEKLAQDLRRMAGVARRYSTKIGEVA